MRFICGRTNPACSDIFGECPKHLCLIIPSPTSLIRIFLTCNLDVLVLLRSLVGSSVNRQTSASFLKLLRFIQIVRDAAVLCPWLRSIVFVISSISFNKAYLFYIRRIESLLFNSKIRPLEGLEHLHLTFINIPVFRNYLQEMFPFQGASNGAYRTALFLLKTVY